LSDDLHKAEMFQAEEEITLLSEGTSQTHIKEDYAHP
jgi:hypothetical protein